MVKAKAEQMRMYPGLFSDRQRQTVQQQLHQLQQQMRGGASGSGIGGASTSSQQPRDAWTTQVRERKRRVTITDAWS